MCAISGAVAALGLLSGSIPVVIGAMLLSPLMGPLVLGGYGLGTMDYSHTRDALGTFVGGVLIGLLSAVVMCWLFPFQDPTSEILARTKPNVVDLGVAFLCGLAGGVAIAKHSGGTIVGVAITTSLMPPTAVIAFGLESSLHEISKGASLLLLANASAIISGVAFAAALLGFGRHPKKELMTRQAVFAALTILPLSFVLWPPLIKMADDARTQSVVRTSVLRGLDERGARMAQLRLIENDSGTLEISVVVLSDKPDSDLDGIVEKRISAVLPGKPFALRIAQIPSGGDLWESIAAARREVTSSTASPPSASSVYPEVPPGYSFVEAADGRRILVPPPGGLLPETFAVVDALREKGLHVSPHIGNAYPSPAFLPDGTLDFATRNAVISVVRVAKEFDGKVFAMTCHETRRLSIVRQKKISDEILAAGGRPVIIPCPKDWSGGLLFPSTSIAGS